MTRFYTFPSTEEMASQIAMAELHRHPNEQPWFVVAENYLTESECSFIKTQNYPLEPYKFPHCNATTRECARPLDRSLSPLRELLSMTNKAFFKYDIDEDSYQGWLQTYHIDNSYQKHMDGAPGECRKLTAVLMLTDENEYDGGDLKIELPPFIESIPRGLGTVCIFPGWALHWVTPVTRGSRQTINLGVWGPAWR